MLVSCVNKTHLWRNVLEVLSRAWGMDISRFGVYGMVVCGNRLSVHEVTHYHVAHEQASASEAQPVGYVFKQAIVNVGCGLPQA